MTRAEWLRKKHSELESIVQQLEQERKTNRSADHKALLQLKKKEKLALKTELNELLSNEQDV
jgi:uncharacterized protein YdcH (DUF465 family)